MTSGPATTPFTQAWSSISREPSADTRSSCCTLGLPVCQSTAHRSSILTTSVIAPGIVIRTSPSTSTSPIAYGVVSGAPSGRSARGVGLTGGVSLALGEGTAGPGSTDPNPATASGTTTTAVATATTAPPTRRRRRRTICPRRTATSMASGASRTVSARSSSASRNDPSVLIGPSLHRRRRRRAPRPAVSAARPALGSCGSSPTRW